MSQEWAPPANFYQSLQAGPARQGEWTPPTNFYQSSPMAPPQGQCSMPPNYQAPPGQQEWAPSVAPYSSSVPPIAGQSVPALHSPAPPSLPSPVQLEYIIPPKYDGDILDEHGTQVYHLTTTVTSPSSTVISDPSGAIIGRIDWSSKERNTTVALHRNKWNRDQFLQPNSDKTFTFRVNQQAGGYTWQGFQNGIQCFAPSGSKVAEFPYRTTSTITLDPAHSELVELVIVTALLIHHQQSRHQGATDQIGEKVTEGLAEVITEAFIKGLAGGA